VLRTTRKV